MQLVLSRDRILISTDIHKVERRGSEVLLIFSIISCGSLQTKKEMRSTVPARSVHQIQRKATTEAWRRQQEMHLSGGRFNLSRLLHYPSPQRVWQYCISSPDLADTKCSTSKHASTYPSTDSATQASSSDYTSSSTICRTKSRQRA